MYAKLMAKDNGTYRMANGRNCLLTLGVIPVFEWHKAIFANELLLCARSEIL